jgi:DUF2075 family protein/SOS-response transcriptional repressor LexA
LNVKRNVNSKYSDDAYDLLIFDSFSHLYSVLTEKEKQFQLCRLVAGYSWEWQSDPKKNNPKTDAIDIEIEGLNFQWNQTDKDWINNPKDSSNPLKEIGCIHTVQGYDLNYTGVIFGKEINYNPITREIYINADTYFDKYGRIGATESELKKYIINIYKTLMYRGIRGTYVYACNKELRDYLKQHIETYKKPKPFRILKDDEVKPYVNSIPLLDISAAAGNFSNLQNHSEKIWIEPPFNISVKKGYFICQVVGESMNKVIPNGSYCLFKEDEGGSRNGKIVLVMSTNIRDSDFGSGYTVKMYESFKSITNDYWRHDSIKLKPMSTYNNYREIVLEEDELTNFKVLGVFVRVVE